VDRYFGGIDILINNAGVIQVGPIESLELADFEQAMQVMFWGPLYMTLAVLPGMRERRAGNIVNITSIGGKVSVPHLIPYCCAKFAGVALSEGLSVELRPAGIRVLTVVPGLMRTGSHLGASFKSDAAKEFSWFALGATLPGISISAEHAARAIIRGIERGRYEEILSLPANILARLHGTFPEVTLPILSLVNNVILPNPTNNTESIVGREAEERLNSSLHRAATTLGHEAARELNQPA
jgi:short-subunit dehydrogenase